MSKKLKMIYCYLGKWLNVTVWNEWQWSKEEIEDVKIYHLGYIDFIWG